MKGRSCCPEPCLGGSSPVTAHRAHCSCPGAASGLQALQGQPQPRPRSSTGQQCSATWCGDWLSLPPCTCPTSYFLLAFVLKLWGSQWEGDKESASLPSPDFGLGLQNDFSPSIQGVGSLLLCAKRTFSFCRFFFLCSFLMENLKEEEG